MGEKRRALIVANSDYQVDSFRGLVSPTRDAEELARVLADPAIGGFDVTRILNQTAAVVTHAIEEFLIFSDPKQDDLLLLYFSGHGVTDEEGLLYLATADTQLVRQSVRRSSAVAAEFIDSTMRRSRSRRKVLVLDCCHSGAFAEGMRIKGDPLPALEAHFKAIQGKGRIVLTASTGTQFAMEGSGDRGAQPSLYTQFLVKGLETGEADHGDGEVDIDELHEYLVDQLRSAAPWQTPTKSGYVEGQLYIARAKVIRPVDLPRNLREGLEATEAWMRLGVVAELEALLKGKHPGLALAARQELEHRRDHDDSFRVREAAARCLAALDIEEPAFDETRRADTVPNGPQDVGEGPEPKAGGPTDVPVRVEQEHPVGKETGAKMERVVKWTAACVAVIAVAIGGWAIFRSRSGHTAPVSMTSIAVPTAQPTSSAIGNPPAESTYKTRVNPADGLTYVFVPPGNFIMGCSPGDTECYDTEKPPHAEKIGAGFWLGQTEVTQAAWKKVNGGANPSNFKSDQLAVESVDWNQASAYCKAIGGRLPIEKEWEYAARAGTTGSRYGALDAVAWYDRNSAARIHPVGLKQPNVFGLYDMLGNVWEWTSDNYDSGTKVVRGGSGGGDVGLVRVSFRYGYEPSLRDLGLGFRCAGEFR